MIKLRVEQRHLKKGNKTSIHNCAFGIALKEMLNNGIESVSIGETFTFLYPKKTTSEYNLGVLKYPNTVQVREFLKRFDRGVQTSEVEFQLPWNIPKQYLCN